MGSEHIPELGTVVVRHRLLHLLEENRSKRISIVTGPPGYGKSTLVAQFAHELETPVFWFRLDNRDRDMSWLRQRLTQQLPDLRSTESSSAAELATDLADVLLKEAAPRLVCVFDDVQAVMAPGPAGDWLRKLVDLLPQNVHLILISRAMPELPYASLLAKDDLAVLGIDELRLTPEEAHDLAREVGEDLSLSDIRQIVQRLEGWPAGVAIALRQRLNSGLLGGLASPEGTFDYLAMELLNSQPAGMRWFLLASSTLEAMTPRCLGEALELANAKKHLAQLLEKGLFATRAQGSVVYHHLFRAFLQRTLYAEDPELFRRLHLQAAEWYHAADQVEEAVGHYIQAGEVETAVARIEVLIALMEAAGRWEQLFAWNETLAAGVSPWLDLACAKGRNLRYEYEEGDRLLARAYAAFEHREEAFGIQAVTLQMGTVAIQQGQIAKAVSLLGPLREDLAREHPLRGRALHSLGRAYVRLGQINRGVQILEEALSVQRKHNDRASVAYINQDLYIAYLRRGEVNKAQAALHEYVALIRQRKDRVRLALALNNLGYFYHQQGQFTLAKDALQEGLQIAAYMSDRRSEGYLCWSLGDLHRDIDEPDTAVYCYERALHTIDDGEPTLRLAVLLSFSVLRRWQGSRHEAMRLAEEAEAIAYEYEIRVEELFAQALQITCRADTDNAQGLLTALNAIKDELVELGAVEQTVRVYAFVARLRLLSDQRNQAQDTLSRAAELAGEGLFPLALECAYTPLLEEYVREAKAFDELVAYIDHIQDAADSEQIESSLAVDATYEIAVRTFGAISIQRDGQATHWAAAAAKRLFLYLLFEGRHTREDISLVFWPDKSAERVRSNFHTTVHRVRQALGESSLVYERPFFQINPHITVWCDAHELREAVETAQLLPVSDARAEELYRKACDLYQGRFLPGFEDDDWVQPRQTFYEDLHNRALIGLGRCIRERGDGENAEMVFKQALELDNLDEAVHRELIITYAQRGDKHLIARHRDLVIGVFESELGVLPSQDLLDLIDLLLSE